MNRQERRAKEKENKKNGITKAEVARIVKSVQKETDLEALKNAFVYLLHVSVMVLKDKYGFGRKRLTEFITYALDSFDSVERHYLTIPDMKDVLFEEAKLTIDDKSGFKVQQTGTTKEYLKIVNTAKETRKDICKRMLHGMEANGAEDSDILKAYEQVLFFSDKSAKERLECVKNKSLNVNVFDVVVFSRACNVSADYLLGVGERM